MAKSAARVKILINASVPKQRGAVNMKRTRAVACTFIYMLIVAMLAGAPSARAADHPDRFTLSSPDFADNGLLSTANLATGTSTRGPWACGGRNVSPALAWSHAPRATKSFAIIMDDPDAASGRGANHWIAYGIAASVSALPRNAGAGSALVTGGTNGRGVVSYTGPCAEPGAKAHHFLWMVFALDLPPGALTQGLTRAQFMRRTRGHNLAEASLSSRVVR
jgi:Raf kinase inhibitor-like YbhB/YbcL family protein